MLKTSLHYKFILTWMENTGNICNLKESYNRTLIRFFLDFDLLSSFEQNRVSITPEDDTACVKAFSISAIRLLINYTYL